MIKTAFINILEAATVSLSAGAENPSFPLYRVYDREVGRYFKPASAATLEIKADQGASGNQAVDRLLIPAGHNLDGMTLDLKYSENDSDYYAAVPQWVQSGGGIINKEWTPVVKRYWKFIITSPAVIPQMAELFLTATYEWEKNPSRPSGAFDPVFNVERIVSTGGQKRYLVHGPERRRRGYHVPHAGETQKTNILALNGAWGGSKPFWLCDHEGVWLYGEITKPIEIKEEAYQKFGFDFEFEEVI